MLEDEYSRSWRELGIRRMEGNPQKHSVRQCPGTWPGIWRVSAPSRPLSGQWGKKPSYTSKVQTGGDLHHKVTDLSNAWYSELL